MRAQFRVAPAYAPPPPPGYFGDYCAPARYVRVLGRGHVPQTDTSVAGAGAPALLCRTIRK